MKSKRVTCTWEFYRDNCEGFKEPMRMELRKLDGYVSNIEAENAKLRTFLGGGSIVTDYWKDEDGTMHVLTTDGEHTYEYMRGGLADENAKLRELCKLFAAHVSPDRCEGCICKSRCNEGEIDECWQLTEIREAAHELGVEV